MNIVKLVLQLSRRDYPLIRINQNGSRYIQPIDIVRSKVARAEIKRQSNFTPSEVKKEAEHD